jgi:hypothetical protein
LQIIAQDRNHSEIALLLEQYAKDKSKQKYKGDNGEILYNRTELQVEFQEAVNKGSLGKTEKILKEHPEFAKDETYFWGEGILVFAAKENNRKMIDLLMSYGAKVPTVLKWAQFYYFERLDAATYMIENGMNPNTMSWHHVTILHDMAQNGDIKKAELLIKHRSRYRSRRRRISVNPFGNGWQDGNKLKWLIIYWGKVRILIRLVLHGPRPLHGQRKKDMLRLKKFL